MAVALLLVHGLATAAAWQPAPGQVEIPLWPRAVRMRAAVLVLPGGGYQVLAMDLEGTEICDWLTARGITW
ncbi:hypothetical protein FHT09_000668 [Xanthomonas arboricola]|nr:hypothetical protein [Xanthomonas sp. CFBP 8152]